MKTALIVCILALALSVYADDDIAAIYAAIPSAKDITRTSDGYRVRDGAGKTIFVTKTSSGYLQAWNMLSNEVFIATP